MNQALKKLSLALLTKYSKKTISQVLSASIKVFILGLGESIASKLAMILDAVIKNEALDAVFTEEDYLCLLQMLSQDLDQEIEGLSMMLSQRTEVLGDEPDIFDLYSLFYEYFQNKNIDFIKLCQKYDIFYEKFMDIRMDFIEKLKNTKKEYSSNKLIENTAHLLMEISHRIIDFSHQEIDFSDTNLLYRLISIEYYFYEFKAKDLERKLNFISGHQSLDSYLLALYQYRLHTMQFNFSLVMTQVIDISLLTKQQQEKIQKIDDQYRALLALDAQEKEMKMKKSYEFQRGDVIGDQYWELEKALAIDILGEQWHVRNFKGELGTIRIFDQRLLKHQAFKAKLMAEIDILLRLEHQHINHLQCWGIDRGIDRFYWVMERYEGESLRERIDRQELFTWEQAKEMLKILAEVLYFCHSMQLIHQEIRPENIIIRHHSRDPVLKDFGIAKLIQDLPSGFYEQVDPLMDRYMPLEQKNGKIDQKSDIYALGISMIEALVGQMDINLIQEDEVSEIIEQMTHHRLNKRLDARALFLILGGDESRLNQQVLSDEFKLRKEISLELREVITQQLKEKIKDELTLELQDKIKEQLKSELKQSLEAEIKKELEAQAQQQNHKSHEELSAQFEAQLQQQQQKNYEALRAQFEEQMLQQNQKNYEELRAQFEGQLQEAQEALAQALIDQAEAQSMKQSENQVSMKQDHHQQAQALIADDGDPQAVNIIENEQQADGIPVDLLPIQSQEPDLPALPYDQEDRLPLPDVSQKQEDDLPFFPVLEEPGLPSLPIDQAEMDLPSLPMDQSEMDLPSLPMDQAEIDLPSLPMNEAEIDLPSLPMDEAEMDFPSLPVAEALDLAEQSREKSKSNLEPSKSQPLSHEAKSLKSGELQQLLLGDHIEFNLVYCEAGQFSMGNVQLPNEPKHTVTLSHPFWISQTPITIEQWKNIITDSVVDNGKAKEPITYVNFFEALSFCNRLSQREGFQPCYELTPRTVKWHFNHKGYRLPTEAEWEYAANANSHLLYAGSNQWDEIGWFKQNAGASIHPVKKKKGNAWQIYDMSGNVWEFCVDEWDGNAYRDRAKQLLVLDPKIWSESPVSRVIRGGSYQNDAKGCLISTRNHCDFYARLPNVGFRVCRNV